MYAREIKSLTYISAFTDIRDENLSVNHQI